MTCLTVAPLAGALAARLARPPEPGVRLFWLGQAGFAIELGERRLVIDPYLSDSLAQKYRGAAFPHERMMPLPVDADGLGTVDLVLATHHHTDHMDPATLRPLLAARPQTPFVVPAASRQLALDRTGIDPRRLVALDAGDVFEPFDALEITATPAAHETPERDAAGRHRFLGYVIEGGDVRIWHSGDCVPFDGLVEAVAPLRPDIALLPVNGRSAALSAQGVPGNFSLSEAIETAAAVGAKVLVAHHYGMFAFNTVDPEAIDSAAAHAPLPVRRAATGVVFEWC